MSYSALRKGRVSIEGQIYFVTVSTHRRQRHFDDLWNARLAVNELRYCDATMRTRTLAWVIMSDHLHWLLELRAGQLQDTVRIFKGRSARAINRLAGHLGPIWQPNFYDHALRSEADLIALARYVVANPLRAGLVDKLGDYPHWDAIWV
jgi:putative transposase